MLRPTLLALALALSLGVVAPARAQEPYPFTPSGVERTHVALGFVGGGSPERHVLASTPESAALVATAGHTFSNRLYVGGDFRWYRGTSPNAADSMHYRATRLTADVGFEFGARHVRFRPYFGVGVNLYRLVLYDYTDARFAFAIVQGGLLTFGRDRGFFAALDLRFAEVLHPRSDSLAPTRGPYDGSINGGVLLGWTFARDVR